MTQMSLLFLTARLPQLLIKTHSATTDRPTKDVS